MFWKRKPNADKRQQAQEQVEQGRRIWTKLVEIEEAVGEPIPPLPPTAFSVPLTDLGWYLRHRLLGEPPRPYLDLPLLRALDLNLRGMALNRDVWPELSVIRLSFLFYHQVLSRVFTPDPGLSDEEAEAAESRFFGLSDQFESLPVESRKHVVTSIAKVLDSTERQVRAFGAFFSDSDPSVVSTAALSVAVIAPPPEDDLLAGIEKLLAGVRMMSSLSPMHAGAFLNGILYLGDPRVLPRVDGAWELLTHKGQEAVAMGEPEELYASHLEYLLRWMEEVPEHEMGLPAGALNRLARDRPDQRVKVVERRFPAPMIRYELSPEEYRMDPPFKVVQEWAVEEYGRALEPRLRWQYMRETHDKVLPTVLEAWGLQVGQDDEMDQYRRIEERYDEDVAAFRQLADGVTTEAGAGSADERARRFIASTMAKSSPVAGIVLLKATAEGLSQMPVDTGSVKDGTVSAAPADLPQVGTDVAAAILWHLRKRLGVDLQGALESMARVELRRRPDLEQSMTRLLRSASGN